MENIKPNIKILNDTLLKILCELRIIKSQQQEIINNTKKEVKENKNISKGWIWN